MENRKCFEVLTTNESDKWDEVLEEIGKFDFFHLAAFHKLAEIRGEGEAVMPVYREGDHVMAFPLLIRDIDVFPDTHSFRDATCVYGQAGPLASSTDIPENAINNLQQHLQDYFKQNQILTVFSRINPLINNSYLLNGYGERVERGVMLAIDLTAPPDVQFMRYKRNRRTEIRRLREMGFICEKVGIDYLDDFMRIYHETMDRVNADPSCYFDRQYFEYLMHEMADTTHLFICRDGETIMCATINTECKEIIQLYLGGIANEYVHLSPFKLMYDAIREWGNEIGARVIQTGGGVAASRDHIYDFKMGFGCQEYVYYTWRHIVDTENYNALCSRAYSQAGIQPDNTYFPMYRHLDLQQE